MVVIKTPLNALIRFPTWYISITGVRRWGNKIEEIVSIKKFLFSVILALETMGNGMNE